MAFFVNEHASDEDLENSKKLLCSMMAEDELSETKLVIVTTSPHPACQPLPEAELVGKLGLDLLDREYKLFRCGNLGQDQKHVESELERMLKYFVGCDLQQEVSHEVLQESLDLVSIRASDVWGALTASVDGSEEPCC